MDVKCRAVMVWGRFLRPQGSLCDLCATALGPPLTLEPRRPGQADGVAGSACPSGRWRGGVGLGLEVAKELVDLADQVALQHPA